MSIGIFICPKCGKEVSVIKVKTNWEERKQIGSAILIKIPKRKTLSGTCETCGPVSITKSVSN
jgi:predicted RNA-binding Zn-ribbon protein involved in translation (DUF1610 family)